MVVAMTSFRCVNPSSIKCMMTSGFLFPHSKVIFLSDNKYQCIDLPDMAICPNNGFMIKQWCPGQDQVCHSCNSTTYSINIPLAILFISHEQYSVKYVELQMVKNSNGQKIDGIFLPI